MKIKRIRPSLNLLMSQSEPMMVPYTPIQYLNLDEPKAEQVEYLDQLRFEV